MATRENGSSTEAFLFAFRAVEYFYGWKANLFLLFRKRFESSIVFLCPEHILLSDVHFFL